MMPVSIRARLAVWYAIVMLATLVVIGVAVSVVHERLGLERIDDELNGHMRAVTGVVSDEISEGFDVPGAARDALGELELPGAGIAVLAPGGQVLATRISGAPTVPPAVLSAAAVNSAGRTVPDLGVRLRASSQRYQDHDFRVVAWMPLAPFEQERATVQNTIRASIPIALVVAATGGWILGWRALKPLTAMAAHADRIDDRRLDERLPVVNARDELGRVGTAFNAVLDRLSSAMQAQRRFMADASHELRTPVSVARTAAQVTLAGATRSEAEYRESLDVIATQTQRLTRMVDDMFMLALADIDARPLDLRDLYLDDVLTDCARAARVLASARAITIAVETPEDVQTRGDEGLLRQLIMNLLENAVRHTPPGGMVRAALRVCDGHAEMAIEDPGPGVPDGDRDRIFERFVRLGPAGSNGGAGLGLPIARWIAEQHGGSLRLDGGSRFVIALPLRAA
jgi:two-component system, OmpR family, sensor kinase